ncbi:polyketide cyclase [Actinosynnema sp. ALI-1.44]|uniref:SRPBCC family protein n=1 Tax=Actinosynnema sp. ALI-1.44 TaxID=1933779 RepID=UPI00097C328E|nr:SRPBCC family protein [Actinosynnema sp. ALI-1.44]ONI89029.1 polyketide cyclase [Actinosynnema sp. ALI-1.44]
MTAVAREVPTAAADVFAVLSDGWSYAGWVVGNSHIRDVDRNWPDVGTSIHHSIGAWPVQIHDVTQVRAVQPDRYLELDARLWWLGAAVISFRITPLGERACRLEMSEVLTRGPAAVLPTAAQAALLRPRNRESLARLADLAVGRARSATGGTLA